MPPADIQPKGLAAAPTTSFTGCSGTFRPARAASPKAYRRARSFRTARARSARAVRTPGAPARRPRGPRLIPTRVPQPQQLDRHHAHHQIKQAATELLERRLSTEKASELAEQLATGKWTHDYPIWASTARALGLTVSTDMPDAVLELMKLYPQPIRTQNAGGVEYLPIPRQKEVAREA